MPRKRVGVIGAGPAGLATLKELVERGHEAVCFEARRAIGGIFNFDASPHVVTVWKGCRLTSSILVTSFSDFFPPLGREPYRHGQYLHDEYHEYLNRYATTNGLFPFIRFSSTVTSLRRDQEGMWVVECNSPAGATVDRFDAVAVCSGLHSEPYIPHFPGIETFASEIIHSSDYKGDPEMFRDKCVVLVGAGESAELAGVACEFGRTTYLSIRRAPFVLPRTMRGVPNDYLGTRLIYSLPDVIVRSSAPADLRLRRFLSLGTFPVRGPLWAFRALLHRLQAGSAAALELPQDVTRVIMKMRKNVGGTQFETFATKTEAFVRAIVADRCQVKPEIAELCGNTVRFVDGTEVEADLIMCCTGFDRPRFPFLDRLVDLTQLDRLFLDRSEDGTLAFIGFVRPNIGSMPPIAEMQARYWAEVLASVPHGAPRGCSSDGRTSWLRYALGAQDGRHDPKSTLHLRVPTLVDFSSYMDDLATALGCKPSGWALLRKPRLLLAVYLAPFCAAQYRLSGPYAKPALAEKVLMHAPLQVDPIRIFDLTASKVASLMGARRLRSSLSLFSLYPVGRGPARPPGPSPAGSS